MTDTTNYYNMVMPFGLKIVGPTYQRLMDKVFTNHLSMNIEVYTDDMVVKSEEVSHNDDLF